MTNPKPLIQKAIDIAGSQKALAEALNLSQQGVSWLLNDAPTVKAEYAVAIDALTQGQVSKHDLRPDLFGDTAS